MSRRTRAQVAAGVRAVHREAAGVVRIDTIMPSELPALLGAAMAGEKHAGNLVHLLDQMWETVRTAPADQPITCAGCSAPIRNRAGGFLLVTGMVDAPAHGIGFIVCERCGPTADAVEAKGVAAAREHWPDLRPLAPMAHGGRA